MICKNHLILLYLLFSFAVFAQLEQYENTELMRKSKVKSLSFFTRYPLDIVKGTQGELVKKLFFNKSGQITRIDLYNDSGKVYSSSRKVYNAKGLLIRNTDISTNDSAISQYTYNANGDITVYRFIHKNVLVQLDSTVYDRYGRKIKFVDYSQDLRISTWSAYSYNDAGGIDTETCYTGHSGEKVYQLKYYYDEKGNLLTKKTISGRRKINHPVNIYDDHNRLTGTEYFNEDSSRHTIGYLLWKDTLLLEKKSVDRQRYQSDRITTTQYTYFSNGLPDGIIMSTDEDRDGYIEKYVYNEKGDLVQSVYYSLGKKLYYYNYLYDAERRCIEKRRFSKDSVLAEAELYEYAADGKLMSKKKIAPAVSNYPKGYHPKTSSRPGLDTTETLYDYKSNWLNAEYDYEATREKPSCFLDYNANFKNIEFEEYNRCLFVLSVMDTLEHKKEAGSEILKLKLLVKNAHDYSEAVDSTNVVYRTIVATKTHTFINDADKHGLELIRIELKDDVYKIKAINKSYFHGKNLEIKAQHFLYTGTSYDTVFYNADGEKIKQVIQVWGGARELRIWKYKNKKLISEEYSNSQGGRQGPLTYTYKYNDSGEVSAMNIYDEKGKLNITEEYLQINGRLMEKKHSLGPEKIIFHYKYEYY